IQFLSSCTAFKFGKLFGCEILRQSTQLLVFSQPVLSGVSCFAYHYYSKDAIYVRNKVYKYFSR
ncbi:MAG: hypothetical protein ACRDEA_22330, partial [Microcystaceae cyanobacterium]